MDWMLYFPGPFYVLLVVMWLIGIVGFAIRKACENLHKIGFLFEKPDQK